jgi:acyl-CoA thioesterase FadM
LLRAADRCVLARARTVWCPIDRQTGKLTAVSAEVLARFSTSSPSAAPGQAAKPA